MIRTIYLVCLILPLYALSQVSLSGVKKESHFVLAYRVPVSLGEKFIRNDSIDVDYFLDKEPVARFSNENVKESSLGKGQFVLIRINDNRIYASFFSVSDLFAYPVNNQRFLQLMVTDRDESFVQNAVVTVNGRTARFKSNTGSYLVRNRKPDGALIKVFTPTDTLFTSIALLDEPESSSHQQRWRNFKNRKLVRPIFKFSTLLSDLYRRRHYHREPRSASGMMVFNQPKFKNTDTVKLKAYLFGRNLKYYKKPVEAWLQYYNRGLYSSISLGQIRPGSPGSFIYQIPLTDTFHNDVEYSVVFKTKSGKQLISESFRLEDYLLDDISKFEFRSDKDTYYPNDSIRFFSTATDANGLSLLDASTRLELTTASIMKFYSDRIYVPDTFSVIQQKLETSGDTKYRISTSQFPDADLNLKANITFTNGNNETQEREVFLNYRKAKRELKVEIVEDSIFAKLMENGRSVKGNGLVLISGDRDSELNVDFPFGAKISPRASSYKFFTGAKNGLTDSASIKVQDSYELTLQRVSRGDSLGFILDNPYGVLVSFTVLDGNRIIYTGKSSDKAIEWIRRMHDRRKAFLVKWQFSWKGEEQTDQQTIALLYKLMDIQVRSNPVIFPGQKDTIAVQVKDYKNRSLSGVNLTAMSYNSQFGDEARVGEPPYLVNYKMKPQVLKSIYEEDDFILAKRYPVGKHPGWIRAFGLDTMPYYKMLFPKKGVYDVPTKISELNPQVSFHVVRKGEREEIYLLYINRKLSYYHGVTEKMKDAYEVVPGYTQAGIRLYDSYLQLDSLYFQPGYKHDVFIDLDSLPKNAVLTKKTSAIGFLEQLDIEAGIFRIQNDSKTNRAYVWQGEKLVKLFKDQQHLVGPFRSNDFLSVYVPRDFDIRFNFEPGYEYKISARTSRLEKGMIFPPRKAAYTFPLVSFPEMYPIRGTDI